MAINSVKDDEQLSQISRRETLIRLFQYLLAYKKSILIVTLIMLVTLGITLVNPILIERAIDVHIKSKDMTSLLKLGSLALVLNITLVLFIKLRMYIMSKLSNSVLVTIRQQLYTHIQTLSFQFFDSRPTGKILARIMGDVNSLKDVLSNSVTTLIPDLLTICSVVVIMFIKNYKLALASLCTFPIMVVGVWFVQTKSHVRWQINKQKNSNLNAFIHEDISGIRIIQSFHAEDESEREFDTLVREQRGAFMDAVLYADAFGPIVDICWGVAALALYYVGVKLIIKGDGGIEVGTLIAFGSYIGMFWHPLLNLSNFYNQLITNISGAERIFEILDTKPDVYNHGEVIDLPQIQGDVEFEHVSFAYDKETKVLNDVSFQIKAGETIALVGPTGAGKSTIINLISRFYDIQEGVIRVDGYDLTKVSIESLREQMGVMTQDNFLFTGTIMDNIRYGKLSATDEEVIEAAKAVNAHDFIMKLEKGYQTELKERGAGLSIGQKQLLAFARTMVSKPNILILDEATSSIDTQTELLVQDGIETLLKNRTSFVIAHRLSTIQKADRIFVIDHGGIVEQGSAKELIEKRGSYYELYMAQFKGIA